VTDQLPSAEASRGETPRDDTRTRPTLIGAIGPGWLRALVVLACVGLALFIAGALWQVAALLAPVLVLFLAGWLLSCVLEPLVRGLSQPGWLRPWAAVGVTYAGLAVVLVLGAVLLTPALARQANATVARLGAAVSGVEQGAADIELTANTWLAERSLPFRLDITSHLTPDVLLGAVQQGVQSASPAAFNALTNTAGLLGNLGLTVLLSVFYAAGGERLASQFERMFSGRARSDVHFTLTIVHDTFARYLRCQVIQGLAYGAGTWVCLSLAHVDGAGLAAIAAGALLLIPLVGTVLALLPPLLGLLTWNPEATLPVLVALLVLQQLVLNGLGPRIMGRELGLPPLLVMGGVLVGVTVSGFWGAILGVPALSVLLKLGAHFRQTGAATDASSGN
jgi:predicted PurR-regulated permease PerM